MQSKERTFMSKEGPKSFVLKVSRESGNVEISHCHFIAEKANVN